MPDLQFHGIQLFLCLLVAAAFMFFAGLVHPKISLWFGEKTRKRSSVIYGVIVGIAIAGLVEVNLIASAIVEHEDPIAMHRGRGATTELEVHGVRLERRRPLVCAVEVVRVQAEVRDVHEDGLTVRDRGLGHGGFAARRES